MTCYQDNGYIAIHIKKMEGACVYFLMAILRVYSRNSMFMDLVDLVEEISTMAVVGALQKYHNMTFEEEAKSIVA